MLSRVERALVATAVGIIRLYQVTLGALLVGVCRFEPSCSRYAQQALLRYGLLGGARRAAGRILRCHPFHPGGADPLT